MTPGWYGKIPATGDFITRRLPVAFIEAWDRWLQEVMGGSRDRLGALAGGLPFNRHGASCFRREW